MKNYKILIEVPCDDNRYKLVDEVEFCWKFTRTEHSIQELKKEAIQNLQSFWEVLDTWYSERGLERGKMGENDSYDRQFISIMEECLKPIQQNPK